MLRSITRSSLRTVKSVNATKSVSKTQKRFSHDDHHHAPEYPAECKYKDFCMLLCKYQYWFFLISRSVQGKFQKISSQPPANILTTIENLCFRWCFLYCPRRSPLQWPCQPCQWQILSWRLAYSHLWQSCYRTSRGWEAWFRFQGPWNSSLPKEGYWAPCFLGLLHHVCFYLFFIWYTANWYIGPSESLAQDLCLLALWPSLKTSRSDDHALLTHRLMFKNLISHYSHIFNR